MEEKIKKLIKKEVKDILSLGFTYSEEVRQLDVGNFLFESIVLRSKDRKIEISYDRFIDCQSLLVSISKIGENRCFSFEDYLLYKGKNKNICYGSLDESEEEYISRFFKLFRNALDDDLLDALKGNTWLDVPPDWASIGR